MKVEPSGVIFVGSCHVQSKRCLAKVSGPVTAIWAQPGRTQVNVCHACLDEQLRSAEWEIPGTRIKRRADVAVYDRQGQLKLVVESKNTNGTQRNAERAIQIRRSLLRHAGIPRTPFFLLAFPNRFYFWSKSPANAAADYQNDSTNILNLYALDPSSSVENQPPDELEMQIAAWLKDVARAETPTPAIVPEWLVASGLYDAIKGGTVVVKPTF